VDATHKKKATGTGRGQPYKKRKVQKERAGGERDLCDGLRMNGGVGGSRPSASSKGKRGDEEKGPLTAGRIKREREESAHVKHAVVQ